MILGKLDYVLTVTSKIPWKFQLVGRECQVKEVRYMIYDKTGISNVNLKQMLSRIETKQELTV